MGMIEIDWTPDRGKLRRFGFVGLVVFGGLGGWIAYRHGIDWKPVALWAGAAVCGVAAACGPSLLRPLFVGMSVIGAPIGFVVSHLILALVYFGIFTPVALAMRLCGRDALHRRLERDVKTYWTDRPRDSRIARYFRQY